MGNYLFEIRFAQVVPRWCTGGAQVVHRWGPGGAQAVPRRCPGGAQAVPRRCPGGAQVVHRWCLCAAHSHQYYTLFIICQPIKNMSLCTKVTIKTYIAILCPGVAQVMPRRPGAGGAHVVPGRPRGAQVVHRWCPGGALVCSLPPLVHLCYCPSFNSYYVRMDPSDY